MDINDSLPSIIDDIILTSKGIVKSFASPVGSNTNLGVYQMEDDYGTSYYYRGAVTNNYVKFAGFYWRIIRVNGDRSLRIIYDGKQVHANGEENTDRFTHVEQTFNVNTANYKDAKYVGWMYGPAGTTVSKSKEQAQSNITDSDIKKVVDKWYKENIEEKGYGNSVSDTLFCNDRSTASSSETWWTGDTKLGYGSNRTAYGAVSRFASTGTSWSNSPNPRFTCPQRNDSFTVSDTTKGNGALTYPVGLITADEPVYI